MKKDKKKIKEPYAPGDTPKPPQIIEPNSGRERENPVQDEDRSDDRKNKNPGGNTKKQRLMSEEADIDDETTI